MFDPPRPFRPSEFASVSPSCVLSEYTPQGWTTQSPSPAHWASVNMALIMSIRKGVFFDRKYWARHSKTGKLLKPVYFSSAIMDDKAQQLSTCALEFGCLYVGTLIAPSGYICRGSEPSCKRSL